MIVVLIFSSHVGFFDELFQVGLACFKKLADFLLFFQSNYPFLSILPQLMIFFLQRLIFGLPVPLIIFIFALQAHAFIFPFEKSKFVALNTELSIFSILHFTHPILLFLQFHHNLSKI